MPQNYLLLACLWLSFVNSIDCSEASLMSDFIYLYNVRLLENKKKPARLLSRDPQNGVKYRKTCELNDDMKFLISKAGKSKQCGDKKRRTRSIQKSVLCNAFVRELVETFFCAFILLQMGGH